jgi:hypothetical protein
MNCQIVSIEHLISVIITAHMHFVKIKPTFLISEISRGILAVCWLRQWGLKSMYKKLWIEFPHSNVGLLVSTPRLSVGMW